MLYEILVTLFAILCFIMILLILIQKGKSSMGLGGMGGGTQLLFGGSGGQDLFQKTTWALGALFMAGSLLLAMVKRPSTSELLGGLARTQPVPVVIPKQSTEQSATGQAAPAQSAATPSEAPQTTEQKA